MGITIRSGSLVAEADQEISGSAPTFLFSPHGPNFGERQVSTNQMKDDVIDAGIETVNGIGQVWTLSNCASASPNAILFRTQLPAHCDKNWSVSLETHFGHASAGQQNTRFTALSVSGRIISGMSASSGKTQNLTGSWTSTAVDFTSNNGGLKQTGWYPYGKLADNSGHFAIPVPPPALQYTSEKSRFLKLGTLVNEAESDDLTSFDQGSILDICLARDLDPTRAHGSDPGSGLGNTNLRITAVKVIFNQFTGSG